MIDRAPASGRKRTSRLGAEVSWYAAGWLVIAFSSAACRAGTRCDAREPGPAVVSDAAFARPSQIVTIAQRRLHLRCVGSGSPTVLLEAGLGGDSSGWSRVQPRLSRETRVCAYDRAGYYFSDPGPTPRTADADVDDLHRLIAAARLGPPFILVGHSLGGLLVRLYAATYPAEVVGMVLLDPVLDNVEDEKPRDPNDAAEEDPLVLRCLKAAEDGTVTRDAARREECIGSPDARLSTELNAAQAEAAARLTTWQTMLSEGKEMRSGRTGARVRGAAEKLESLPLVVVTKGRLRTASGDEGKLAEQYYGRAVLRHAALAGRSSRGLHLIARSGHQIHVDDPDTVATAVQWVLRAYREKHAGAP